MARLFAIADLHLSGSGAKPMDRFGEIWRDHATKIARHWDALVDSGDTVLLAGDLSWARSMAEAEPDLAWIGARPGRKILLRGNHDGWWSSLARVRAALPEGCHALQNDAVEAAGWCILGARGWTAPDDPIATEEDARVFERELARLNLSIEDAERRLPAELPRLALMHYPPWIEGRPPTAVVELLERARVEVCVYGHLHGDDHRLAVTGERRGIRYVFTSVDATDFRPVEIERGAARTSGARRG